MGIKDIERGYANATAKTLARWEENPGCGAQRDRPFYSADKLAITSGIQVTHCPAIAPLLDELQTLLHNDKLADVQQLASLHFTFLAITPAVYPSAPDTAELVRLKILWERIRHPALKIAKLRLVLLPDQLLLAGIPDEKAIAHRQQLVMQLLDSPWQSLLRQRHPTDNLPPLFWHSTLLRYQAEFLPQPVRQLFAEYQQQSFGEVEEPLKLVLANYNWHKVHIIA